MELLSWRLSPKGDANLLIREEDLEKIEEKGLEEKKEEDKENGLVVDRFVIPELQKAMFRAPMRDYWTNVAVALRIAALGVCAGQYELGTVRCNTCDWSGVGWQLVCSSRGRQTLAYLATSRHQQGSAASRQKQFGGATPVL